MRLIKNHLSLLHSESMFLCSSSNQKNTDQDINILGKNLADEVF